MLESGKQEAMDTISAKLLQALRALQADSNGARADEKLAQGMAEAIVEPIIDLIRDHALVQGTTATQNGPQPLIQGRIE